MRHALIPSVVLILAVVFAAPAVFAQAPTASSKLGGSITQRYEKARHALEEDRAAEAKTAAEHDRLAKEAEDLRARLIATATRVQALEEERSAAEAEIAQLQVQLNALQQDFARDRDQVAHLLAVLQRLDADEPPALAIRPDDSLAAARGAMLVGAMLPPVYEGAANLARRLRALRAAQAALENKRSEARATEAALDHARTELAALLDNRSAEAAAAEGHLGALHTVTEQVAHETDDLKSLMDRIAALRAQTGGGGGMTVVTAQNMGPMAARRGALRRPVVGHEVPGGPDAPGPVPTGAAPGLWFVTAGGAEAVAPADSEVVFAGPYQKFGQVLILEIAGGYDLLLAGLGRINVRIGDSVLAGEPVGTLPSGSSVHLYMELRHGGQTVNPAPWLAAELRKAKGT